LLIPFRLITLPLGAALLMVLAGDVWCKRIQLMLWVRHLLEINVLVMMGLEHVCLVLGRVGVIRHAVPGPSGKYRWRLISSRLPRIHKYQVFNTDKNK
jgi:hypothetical protein